MMIVRSLLALSFVASAMLLACSSSEDPTTPAGTTTSTGDGGAGGTGAGGTGTGAGGTDSGTCGTIPPVTGATLVNASFQNLNPPSVVPPVTTGGTLSGRFRTTQAKVFLPAETSSFIDVSKSSGTVTSWAAFSGDRYRLHLEIHLVIATSIGGNQKQDSIVDSEGTFTTAGNALTLVPTCDTTDGGTGSVAYTFTTSATAQTIVLNAKVPPFNADSYTELDAVPE